MAITGKDIHKAAVLLKQGAVVAIPTETVYGLAGNALNEDAILQIYKVKNRPMFDPLIAHTDSLEKVQRWVEEIPAPALELARHFWPGPMTLLLKKKAGIPDLLTSGLPSMAVRVPRHPLTLELLSMLDFPLAAPSANPFGYVSPTSAGHVDDQLGAQIPYILDGGTCEIGIESTIIGFDEFENPVVYRLGGKKVEDIEKLAGQVQLRLNQSSDPLAPGMLKSHYAPGKAVYIGNIADLITRFSSRKPGIISFYKTYRGIPENRQIVLSEKGDLHEAAKNLFGALRTLDGMDIDLILTHPFPEEGLGRAINDRLRRAAAR